MIIPLKVDYSVLDHRISIVSNTEYTQAVINIIYANESFNAITLMKFNALLYATEKSVETKMHSMLYSLYSANEFELKSLQIMDYMKEVFIKGLYEDGELNRLHSMVINKIYGN